MTEEDRRFLFVLRAALEGTGCKWDPVPEGFRWKRFFRLAETHRVLPLIMERLYDCEEFLADIRRAGLEGFYEARVGGSVRQVAVQMIRTDRFLELYRFLGDRGLRPIVVKGLPVRVLYRKPEYRPSSDEDLFIEEERFPDYHQALLDFGMRLVNPEEDPYEAEEPAYEDPATKLYLELHKRLFPTNYRAYGGLNRFFTGLYSSAETVRAVSPVRRNGIVTVRTMPPDRHLLFLVLHVFKHFAHSGFGIRQVCDICALAESEGKRVDWETFRTLCREVTLEEFAAAIFRIGEVFLGFQREKAGIPETWDFSGVDEGPLLADILEGGLYGVSSIERARSSNIMLGALSGEFSGPGYARGILRSLFPPAEVMSRRYRWLERSPALLPAAWVCRIIGYLRESTGSSAKKSVEIGQKRLELLAKYHILDESDKM